MGEKEGNNMLKPVRIVLVGVGGYGHIYLDALTERNLGAALVGVCDVNPAVAEKFPVLAERKIPVYPSLEAFFAADTADLAIIVSPVHFHTEMVLTCLRRGVHVLCEKPMAVTEEELVSMEGLEERFGVKVGICFQNRYNATFRRLLELVQKKTYGKLKAVKGIVTWTRGEEYYREAPWRGIFAESPPK